MAQSLFPLILCASRRIRRRAELLFTENNNKIKHQNAREKDTRKQNENYIEMNIVLFLSLSLALSFSGH